MIKLGSRVRDNITGFTGIAVARTEWLFGCSRIGVESVEMKDGKPVEPQWFDEQRIELVEEKKPVISLQNTSRTGGPQADPVRSSSSM